MFLSSNRSRVATGVIDWVFVDDDFQHARLGQGNSILLLHAFLPLMYVFNTIQNTKLTPDQVLQEFYARRLRKDGLQQTKDLREFSSHQQTCIRPDNFLIVPMKRQGVEDC